MNKNHQIVLDILKYETDPSIVNFLKDSDIDWIQVLGYLTYHRVAGLAYKKINDLNIRLFDYPVFFTTYLINQAQEMRNKEQQKNVIKIAQALNENNIEYVFLKGTIMNLIMYENGTRASNDIDILINKKDIYKVTKILNTLGFIQGKYDYKNNRILPFSSDEKSNTLETIGETSPFVKISDFPTLKTTDVDLNFSLDWNPNSHINVVNVFLKQRILVNNKGVSLYSLCYEHMFIELCVHLYKDSALIDIIKKRKVLDLYKFVDIYYFIMKYFNDIDILYLTNEVKKYKLNDYIYFALMYVTSIFPEANIEKVKFLINNIESDNNILNLIFDQYDKKNIMITKSTIIERLFSYNLISKYKGDGENV